MKSVKRRLTLRVSLALWVVGLLLTISIGLLVLVNVATPITTTKTHVITGKVPVTVMTAQASDGPDILFGTSSLEGEAVALPPESVTVTFPAGTTFPSEAVYPSQTPPSSPLDEAVETQSYTVTSYTITFQPTAIDKLTGVSTSAVREDVFHEMRVISLIGLGVIVLLGGFGAYWLSGRALRPVRKLAQAAQGIDAQTLDTRLNLTGPEDELKRLANSFDSMMNRLELAFEKQGRFVADAAHELRTPLTTLRASLNVTAADPNSTIGQYREMSSTLERALTRLQRLVDDLLLLATDEHSLPDTPIVLEPLLEEAMFDLKPLADQHSVNLRLTSNTSSDGLMTRGDSKLLVRVFHNLIENGIRYNKSDGEVAVSVSEEGRWATVTIEDSGIGIASEQLSNIFDRFYRVDGSRARHSGGAGLGLSIAAYVVGLHKGQIEVRSTVGVGTAFIVKLPLWVA
ncbi:MAG: HAMP domain-containing sensor histidine kinase [Dehalococcoidia bacterium]|nr:HAMP domain-containing sensor histidine kinase [Dehalococcoidia bacterium]